MTTQTASMTTSQIASRLVDLCRKGDYETAQKELYAADVMSIEPFATPDFDKETKGLDAILEKGRKFQEMVETMHSYEVSEPLVTDNCIVFKMGMDLTMKDGKRWNSSEICLYNVKDGKIISEQFFI